MQGKGPYEKQELLYWSQMSINSRCTSGCKSIKLTMHMLIANNTTCHCSSKFRYIREAEEKVLQYQEKHE